MECEVTPQEYEQAVKFVTVSKKPLCSLLQRKMRIGYMRAAHLMELLEERGIVTSPRKPSTEMKGKKRPC